MSEKHRVRLTLEYTGPEPAFVAALKAALKVLGRGLGLRCVNLALEPTNGTVKAVTYDLPDGH
jgi:hypothetical protein